MEALILWQNLSLTVYRFHLLLFCCCPQHLSVSVCRRYGSAILIAKTDTCIIIRNKWHSHLMCCRGLCWSSVFFARGSWWIIVQFKAFWQSHWSQRETAPWWVSNHKNMFCWICFYLLYYLFGRTFLSRVIWTYLFRSRLCCGFKMAA